jgi:O-antigen ligase
VTWFYRAFCIFCFVAYAISYSRLIGLRLPLAGLALFCLTCARPNVGVWLFTVFYPVLLYFNQYPEHHFSTPAFLALALVLALSFRTSARIWIPLFIVGIYVGVVLSRQEPHLSTLFQSVWTTDQVSPLLGVGTCVMWATGIMLFDFLRRTNPVSLYYAMIAQGALMAGMSVANMWLRHKPFLYYEFIFGDIHAFAAYFSLQAGLLTGLVRKRVTVFKTSTAIVLFAMYSILLAASSSRTGMVAYIVIVCFFVSTTAISALGHLELRKVSFYQRHWGRLLITILASGVLLGASAWTLKHELMPRLTSLKSVWAGEHRVPFYLRVQDITPEVVFKERVHMWAVADEMLRQHPFLGIGVGNFYRNSKEVSEKISSDVVVLFPENAHNYYWQIAAETGVPGLLLLLTFLVWLLWHHWRLDHPVRFAAGTAVMSILIISLTQHPLLVDRIFFVFVTICAVLVGEDYPELKHDNVIRTTWQE